MKKYLVTFETENIFTQSELKRIIKSEIKSVTPNNIIIDDYSDNYTIPKADSEYKIFNVSQVRFARNKYPFREMKINDAIIFDKPYSRHNMSLASNSARNFIKKSTDCKDRKYKVRKTIDNKIVIYRTK